VVSGQASVDAKLSESRWPKPEAGGNKVAVEAEDIAHALFFHQNKRQAVGEGNCLVGELSHLREGGTQIVFVCSQPLDPGAQNILAPVRSPSIVGAPRKQRGCFVKDVLRRVKLRGLVLEAAPEIRRPAMVLIRGDFLG
jgi:hypothetical protein